PVCTAAPEERLRDAARRMEKEGAGLLVVVENDRLAGVLTDRDLALHGARGGRAASKARVADAMSQSPVSVGAEASVQEALRLLRSHRVRRLPVLDAEDRVLGLLAADDLVRLLAAEIGGLAEVLAAQLPAGTEAAPEPLPRRTSAHYSSQVVATPETATAAELARAMQERAVGSVVVLDDEGRAAGIVTDRDLALRVVAAGLDPEKTEAAAVMSAPLLAAAPTDPLEALVERMRITGVRRIPVLEDGRPVGLVSFDDLLVAFAGELEQLAAGVSAGIRAARTQSYPARLRRELEERLDEAATQLREFGEQTLRSLGGEVEQVVDRVVQSLRAAREGATGTGEARVADLMRTDVRSCTPDDSLREAARSMWEGDCGCVPVIALDGSGRVVGMITDRDVCMAAYTGGGRLAETPVREAMATRVYTCRAEDRVSVAEERMRSAQVRRLPVVDEAGRLQGMLSLADLAEAAAGLDVREAELARTLEAICRPRGESVSPRDPREPDR
nr:CBS domain-containing protein [Myxococcota bacterium]